MTHQDNFNSHNINMSIVCICYIKILYLTNFCAIKIIMILRVKR